ncbi:MAG: PEP/pyruvate-binding domain-containing protein, partial [Candidatus Heimdallarchaeaceae archaeon]
IGERTMGSSVEIEFAVNFSEKAGEPHEFYLLQIRPFLQQEAMSLDFLPDVQDKDVILSSPDVSGHMLINDVKDIIFIRPEAFDNTKTLEMLEEVDQLNNYAIENNLSYILVGIGRWGSSDRFLGIPAKWNNINKAKVIVEVSTKDFQVDFSQGSHFFHNIVTANVGYLHLKYGSNRHKINWQWLNSQEIIHDLNYFRHVRTKENITICIDAQKHVGMVFLSNAEIE